MNWYTFWINRIIDGKSEDKTSAEKIEIEAENYFRGLMNFSQKYGENYELTINGLSNREKIIDLNGEEITITCQGLKIINQVTIQNGVLNISPKYDCSIIRSNLNNIKISLDPNSSSKLFISGSKCSKVNFTGEGIVFDGPVEGDYEVEENDDNVNSDIDMHIDGSEIKESKAKNNIPIDVFQKLASKLGTTDTVKILEAYNKLKQKDSKELD